MHIALADSTTVPAIEGPTVVSGTGTKTAQAANYAAQSSASFTENFARQAATPQQRGYQYADIGTDYHNFGNSIARYTSGGSYGPEQDIGEAIVINVADYQPKQVRQSLLEQKDVPVFILLKGLTINSILGEGLLEGLDTIPPIDNVQVDTSNIDPRVRSISYYPPRRGQYSLNNMGYLVVYLKQIDGSDPNLSTSTIDLNLNAKIFLDLESNSLFGIGRSDLALKQETEQEFINKASRDENSFFSGRGFLRLESLADQKVNIEIYNKDLYPVSLQSPFETTKSGSGLSSTQSLSLSLGKESQIYSLGYTGNPLQDHFRVRLEEIITPEDNAQIELEFGGKTLKRKVIKGKRIYPSSNWVVSEITHSSQKLDSVSDLNKFPFASEQEKQDYQRQLTKLTQKSYSLTIRNAITKETQTLSRNVLLATDLKDLIDVMSPEQVEQKETTYCPSNTKDYACIALRNFQQLYFGFPGTPESEQALDQIIDIYDKKLLEVHGVCKTKDNPDFCKIVKSDQTSLRNYYQSLKPESEEPKILKEEGSNSVFLANELTTLDLISTDEVGQEEKGKISYKIIRQGVAGEERTATLGKNIIDQAVGDKEFLWVTIGKERLVWKLEEIRPQSVGLRLYTADNKAKSQTVSLPIGKTTPVTTKFATTEELRAGKGTTETVDVQVTNIEVENEAYLSIIPGSGRAFTTAEFSLHIPIDPRPFEWTPDKLESQIKTTQELIEKLDTVINRLEKVVQTWKKVCLATFAFLTVKSSFLGGFERSIARQEVANSYKQQCQTEMLDGKFTTLDQCYSSYASEMTRAIDATQKEVKEVNKRIKGKTSQELAQEIPECKGFLLAGGSIEDCRDYLLYSGLQEDYNSDTILGKYAEQNIGNIALESKNQIFQEVEKLGIKDPEEFKLAAARIERERQAQESSEEPDRAEFLSLSKQGEFASTAKVLLPLKNDDGTYKESKNLELKRLTQKDYFIWKEGTTNENDINKAYCKEKSYSYKSGEGCFLDDKKVESLSQIKKELQAPGNNLEENNLPLFAHKDFFTAEGPSGKLKPIIFLDSEACEAIGGDPALLSNNCEVQPFTSRLTESTGRLLSRGYAPAKEMIAYYNPAGQALCYPTGNGEYVQVLEHYANGGARTFRVMNVGPNGRINCGLPDDEQILHESQLEQDPKLKSTYAAKVNSLPRCKNNGDRVGSITVDGKSIPLVCNKDDIQKIQESNLKPSCFETMDPTDCKLLFNACDPVMCPSSRCTLGGRVPERNVIQSGIVGSTLLCLPNVQEGIVVPVCLTGIHAGLKNIRSLLEGYEQCLDASLKDNKNVGVCDYIRSVGICELIWKEAINLLDIGGRGVLDWASGKIFGEAKGGGEYLSFQSSFDNVGKSFDFFTNEYSNTYIAHYASRSTDEVGTQVCRLSVHGQFPGIGNIIDQLTEPEDPPQFTAFFDEAPYSTIGESYSLSEVPLGTQELSTYKVFYHIYAGTGAAAQGFTQPQSLISGDSLGTDLPISYSVYLVNKEAGLPPLYVTNPGERTFAGTQGRVEPGSYVQQTVQKVGAKGYNQICVNINGQESCGFGKASSSFGLTELNDFLVEDEASREDIQSAQDCIPNAPTLSPSLSKLATIGTTGSLATPEKSGIFSTGISRVCSHQVPTPEAGRWTEVGSCGEDDNGISLGSCWLDGNSIHINDKRINNELRQELQQREATLNNAFLLTPGQARSILSVLNGKRKVIFEELATILDEVYKNEKHIK